MTESPAVFVCPVCGSPDKAFLSTVRDVEYYTTDDTYDYFQCQSCQTVYLRDPPIDQLSVIYPDNYYSFNEEDLRPFSLGGVLYGVKKFLDKRFLRKISGTVAGDSLSALDIGGGTGFILDCLKEADPRVGTTCVVDLDAGARQVAEGKGHSFLESTIEDAELGQNFDVVVMYNLIEHVADPEAVLRKISTVMNKGGVLVLKTPTTEGINFRMFRHKYWGGYHAPRHFVLFNRQNFKMMVDRLDFADCRFSFTQGAPMWVKSVIGTRRMKDDPTVVREPETTGMMLLMAVFAAFDLLTLPFMKKDQMFIILRK